MSAAVLVSSEGSTHHLGVPAGMSAFDLDGKKSLTTMKPSGSAGYAPDWKKPGPRMCEAVSVNPENTGNYVSAFRRQFPFLLSTDPTLFPQGEEMGLLNIISNILLKLGDVCSQKIPVCLTHWLSMAINSNFVI